MQDGRWYRGAIVYEVDVRSYMDSNGDGIGDLPGLQSRLPYLARLGITCLWLLPVHPSPLRDDGYDVTDHYAVHPDLGTAGDLVELIREANDHGIRVVLDIVLNHTSDEHPWFQAARRGEDPYVDYYVWADERPPDAASGLVFPGVQKSTWSYDRTARRYYFHRFYEFQPDLNIANPEVRDEMRKILGFWARLGIAGFRVDALPFLIEPAGAAGPNPGPYHEYLREMIDYLGWRMGDATLLGEANLEPEEIDPYFTRCGVHMLFNFLLNQHTFLALARGEAEPLRRGVQLTSHAWPVGQWASFLRNHDEIDLGRLSEQERAECYAAFGPDPSMQLYDRGIRRRLAPMLGGDRRRIQLAQSLSFTLPGTPVLYYGDEIGMGDDLSLQERDSVRTPMQWTAEANGGFSTAPRDRLFRPVVSRGTFSYRKVNVADQRSDPGSLLNWFERMIRARKECPEMGSGPWSLVETRNPCVFALRAGEPGVGLVTVHNLSDVEQSVKLDLEEPARRLTDVFGDHDYEDDGDDHRTFALAPYGYRWLRLDP